MTGAAPDLTTFEGRLHAVCQWFDLTLPALTYDEEDREGGPLLTEDLLEWMRRPDVPVRWLLSDNPTEGDPRARAEAERGEREFLNVLRRFDDEEVRLMVEAVEASQRGEIAFEAALEDWKRDVQTYRAGLARGNRSQTSLQK